MSYREDVHHTQLSKAEYYKDPAKKPIVLPVRPDGIPPELTGHRRWVLWQLEWRGSNWTKVPKTVGGQNASVTNENTWGTYDQVISAYQKGGTAGLGYVLGGEVVGIDLDDVRSPVTGQISAGWAADLIAAAATAVDISPSGTGVKLFGRGRWPGGWHRRNHPSGAGEIEVYNEGRFFCVTGHSHEIARPVADIQPTLDRLVDLFGGTNRQPSLFPASGVSVPGVSADSLDGPDQSETDDELLARIRRSRGADKFNRLWAGDTSGHGGDESRSDLALCSILAYWTGGDADRVDRLFRQSALFRAKWDSRRGASTYGWNTVVKAISGTRRSHPTSGPTVLSAARVPAPPPAPAIVVGPDEFRVNEEAARALARHPAVYQRGGVLVHVPAPLFAADGAAVRSPGWAPGIRELSRPMLREYLTRCANWEKWKRVAGNLERVPTHPPDWAVAAVYDRGQWPGVPRLDAVVPHPVLLPDGTLLTSSGYHASTGVLVRLPPDLTVQVPENPTQSDVRAAVQALLDPLTDFPFAGDQHRATLLAGLLTPLAWHMFDGPAPFFLIDSNTRGSGKGLLADVIALTLTGQRFPVSTYTPDRAEFQKTVTAFALEGERLVLFDNLDGRVGHGTLDAALTTDQWKGRLLGGNRLYAGPLQVTWFGTGNNVCLHADTARRTAHVRLETAEERPELRGGFRYPDLRAHVRRNRAALLSAALTVLRGWAAAGRPTHGLPAWGSFEGWSGVVREAVLFAGLPDPGGTRSGLIARADLDAGAMAVVLASLGRLDTTGKGVTVAEVVHRLRSADGSDDWLADLGSAVEDLCPRLDARELGYKFRQFAGRNFGGRVLEKAGEDRTGVSRWQVVDVSRKSCPPTP